MKPFKKSPPEQDMDRGSALQCRPVRNTDVQERKQDSGEVMLLYPVTVRPWFEKWVRRLGGPEAPVRIKKLQLDELGTAVWDLMDGERTVGQVIEAFAAAYRLHPKEAEVSVTLFLRDLGRRGIVGLK